MALAVSATAVPGLTKAVVGTPGAVVEAVEEGGEEGDTIKDAVAVEGIIRVVGRICPEVVAGEGRWYQKHFFQHASLYVNFSRPVVTPSVTARNCGVICR